MSARPWWTRERPDRGLVRGAFAFALVAIALVLAVALGVRALAPASWQSLISDQQRTDATALTVISIWANNLLICCLPVLAGAFAHRLVASGHRSWSRLVIAIATLAVLRSLLIIGLVGGLDPGWLVSASPWWTLESIALSGCSAAGWRAVRSDDSAAASRQLAHALAFAVGVLALAAVVEVAAT